MIMKKILSVLYLLFCLLYSCTKDIVPNHNETEMITRAVQQEQVFYYYGIEDRKIHLNPVNDKVYVKFAPDATKEQFLSIATENALLRATDTNVDDYFIEGYSSNAITLEG